MSDDLEQQLEELEARLRERLDEVLHEQAQRLSDAQRAALRSLEQDPADSGNLEESCRVEPRERPLEYIVKAGGDLTTTEVREGSGEPYDYANAFEFGSSRQPARPFFYSTYRAMKADIEAEIANAIDETMKEI